MFGRSNSRAECPIDQATRRWVETRWAWLIEAFGITRLRVAKAVVPSPEFFPDAYSGHQEDLRAMLDRVCGYMALNPQEIVFELYHEDKPQIDGMQHGGTNGLYQESKGRFHIWIEDSRLDDPASIVATMAHELSHVHLLGHRRIDPETEDHEELTDLLTVFLGLGVLTANAVIRSTNERIGNMERWSVSRSGYLSMDTFGYALALWARDRGEHQPAWSKQLRPDVAYAFRRACAFVAQGPAPEMLPATRDDVTEKDVSDSESMVEVAPEFVDEPEPKRHVFSADEILQRYESGERNFTNFKLRGFGFRGVCLQGVVLAGADLSDADLTDAVLADSDLRGADLQRTNLRNATMRNCDLRDIDFSEAELSSADLTGSDLRGADLSDAMLQQTILLGVKIDRDHYLHATDLSSAICDEGLKRYLTGNTLTQRVVGGIRFVFGMFLVLFLAMMISGVLLEVVGKLMGIEHLVDSPIMFLVMSTLLLGLWLFNQQRKKKC